MEQIKVGDIVRVSESTPEMYTDGRGYDWLNQDSEVTLIEGEDALIDSCEGQELPIPTKYLIKVNAEPKEKPYNTIAIPVEADLTDSFWRAYEADLAKEIAVKIASPLSYNEKAVAEYAVRVAKSVVENLKKAEL